MAQPALEHPRVYALRFVFEDNNGQCHPLLEPDQPLKMPNQFKSSLLLEKLGSITTVTRVGVQNFSLAQLMNHKIAHFFLLLICNCLPFHSRVRDFMAITSKCSICHSENGDNPTHLLTQCQTGKMALTLLKAELHDACMTKTILSAEQLFYHLCFAKALWKARCQAIWCINQVSPNYICTLFWEAVSKTKKTAPPLEAQRSVIPLDDIDDWSVRTRRFIFFWGCIPTLYKSHIFRKNTTDIDCLTRKSAAVLTTGKYSQFDLLLVKDTDGSVADKRSDARSVEW
eukprot:TRINITY_DN117_c0_g1_i3.p1 TRINITY_DN117_c0_g1~~TRINITY_DN117_c0_g1_i3.p1  ORF type:complete len:285 (-),score=27.18 TRINITY_DN117_c0_g1_i3:467-1321(-)